MRSRCGRRVAVDGPADERVSAASSPGAPASTGASRACLGRTVAEGGGLRSGRVLTGGRFSRGQGGGSGLAAAGIVGGVEFGPNLRGSSGRVEFGCDLRRS